MLASKKTFLSSTSCYGYLLCQNKKYQSYYYSIFVLHVYSSSRAKVWALSCLSCRFYFLYLSHSIHLSFSFLSPPFLFALAASFGGALCSMAKRAKTAVRPPKIRFPLSLRQSISRDYLCNYGVLHPKRLLSVSASEWSFFKIDVGECTRAVYPMRWTFFG